MILQSLPVGEPDLVQPSLTKQDIGQLRKDLPKYESLGVMSPDSVETEIERHFGRLPEDHNEWILDTIPPVDQRRRGTSPSVVVSERVMKCVETYKPKRQVCEMVVKILLWISKYLLALCIFLENQTYGCV